MGAMDDYNAEETPEEVPEERNQTSEEKKNELNLENLENQSIIFRIIAVCGCFRLLGQNVSVGGRIGFS